jgi:DNA-binding NarL/FixJ family response regulator
MMREGLGNIISKSEHSRVADEAADGLELLAMIACIECDMVLMDMSMPGLSGVELITKIRKSSPKIPILVLSMHNGWKVASAAIRAGANGYITKDSDPACLLDAIQLVARGQRHIDPDIAEMMRAEVAEHLQPNSQLSDRENQILRMVVCGKSTKQIASELTLSPQTVSTHKKRIMEKINVDNTAAMVRYYIERDMNDNT